MKIDVEILKEKSPKDIDWCRNFCPVFGMDDLANEIDIGESEESKIITKCYLDAICHSVFPIITEQKGIEAYFKFLVSKWKAETQLQSSVKIMIEHPAYQKIIALGKEAIPLLLNELSKNPNHWFVALKRISNEDPVNKEDRGNIKKMVKSWLNWGREQGYEI